MNTQELILFVESKNKINSVLNALVPELQEILEKNPPQFKKDLSFTKKTRDMLDKAISGHLTHYHDQKIRVYVENSARIIFNEVSGSLILKVDTYYQKPTENKFNSCAVYVKNYCFFWEIEKNKKYNFEPIPMVTVNQLELAKNRIKLLDEKIDNLTTERNNLKSLFNAG